MAWMAFGLLSVAVALGVLLLVARPPGQGFARLPRGALGAIHGLIGLAGAAAVLIAWSRGGLHGKAAADALVLLGAGLLGGLAIAGLAWRKRRVPGGLIAIHAAVAAFGTLLLAGAILG